MTAVGGRADARAKTLKYRLDTNIRAELALTFIIAGMPAPAGSLRALGRSGGAVAAARVFDLGASYVFYIVLARAVGVQEFGALVLAMSVVQTAGVFTRLGLDTASTRKSAEALAAGETGVGRIVVIAAGIAGALSIAGMGILMLTPYRDAFAGVNRLVLFSLPILGVAPVFAATLRGLGRVRLAAIGESILQPALALIMVVAALVTRNVTWASGSLLVSTFAVLVFCAVPLMRRGLLRGGHASAGALVRLGITIAIFTGLNSLASALGVLVIGRMRTMTDVALFAAAVKSARAILLAGDANLIAVMPTVPHLLRDGDLAHLGVMYRTSVRWITLITAPAAIVLVVAPELVLRLFGSQFAPAAILLRILVIAFAIFAIAGPAKAYLLMAGYERYLTINAAINVIATGTLLIAMTWRWGTVGAAVAIVAATLLQRALLVLKVQSALGVSTFGRRNVILIGGFAAALGVWAMALPAGRIAAGAAAMIVFAAAVILAGFDESDREVLRGILGALRPA